MASPPDQSDDLQDDVQALALSNCAREPIHIPGSIQSHGALVVTDRALETITHVSANLGEFLGQQNAPTPTAPTPTAPTPTEWTSASVLNQPLQTIFPWELVHELCNVCGLPNIHKQPEHIGRYHVGTHVGTQNEQTDQLLDVTVHVSGVNEAARTIIELTDARHGQSQPSTSIFQVKAMLDELSDPSRMLDAAVKTLRQKTGFDRVMAYKFLADGTGEVAAEACTPALTPFLGLRYPASDIPEQVRSLAIKTGLRTITNTQAASIPILSGNPQEPTLDLSLAALRSVSPIHLEYLGNMGIKATINISITVNNQLWGLFAFHHTQPKQISTNACAMLELFGQLFSLRFQQVLTEAKFRDRKRAASTLTNIVNRQTPNTHWQNTIIQAESQLRELVSAHGIAFISTQPETQPKKIDPPPTPPQQETQPPVPETQIPETPIPETPIPKPVVTTYGDVPPETTIVQLVNHYTTHAETDIIASESLQQLNISSTDKGDNSAALSWGKCAGALWLSLPSSEPLHILFFRNETVHEIRWGGNPEKKDITYGAFGPRLLPRSSFAEYTTTMRGRCEPWSQRDLAIALEMNTELLRLVEHRTQDFQQRQQNLLVTELNHRVTNILALIRSIARQTKESSHTLTDYVTMLEHRITALATAHELVAGYELEWPTLRQLLLIEMQPYLVDKQPRVQLVGDTVGLKASFVPTFVLVIHELATNAVKHGALSISTGKVAVNWYATDGGVTIHWKEIEGPAVNPPKRNGFGRELIERAIPYEFEGEAELVFHPTGVEAQFWLPSDLVRWQDPNAKLPTKTDDSKPHSNTAPTTKSLGAVLVVEDNMLLTMEMENLLKEMGFTHIDAAPSVARAQKLLASNQYRICVLDIDLKKETSFDIARELIRREIPFTFTSGYDSKHAIPDELAAQILVKKPIELAQLKAAFQKLIDL